MARDIEVKVFLSTEEYVALKILAEDEGMSHSGLLRSCLKARLRKFAHDSIMADAQEYGSAEAGLAQAGLGQINPTVLLDREGKK